MPAAANDNSPDYSQLGWKGFQDEEDEVLTAAYNKLNHELFGGTMPAPASIAWRNEDQMTDWDGWVGWLCLTNDEKGEIFYSPNGKTSPMELMARKCGPVIRISTKYRNHKLKDLTPFGQLALTHEMVHVWVKLIGEPGNYCEENALKHGPGSCLAKKFKEFAAAGKLDLWW